MAVEIGTAHLDLIPRFNPDIPRIQVLELPVGFALVVDGAGADTDLDAIFGFKDAIGAKAVLVTQARISV